MNNATESTMQAKDLDTNAAGNKWWASRDAAIKSYAESTRYSAAERLAAERMKLGLEIVYASKAIHVNYRGKFIAIKIEMPQVRDRKMLAVLEKDYSLMGIVKRLSPQGLIYRIPKAV